MSNFSLALGQKLTTNNSLILQVIDVTNLLTDSGYVTIYASKAVGRAQTSDTDPSRPLPQNIFYHRADGVRLKQQGEDCETNINFDYKEPAPTLLPSLLSSVGPGQCLITANGLVLEVTEAISHGPRTTEVVSRAVGRAASANEVNFGTPLPRNEFIHNADGMRTNGGNAETTRVVRILETYETIHDFRPLTRDNAPARRVGSGPVDSNDGMPL